MQMTLEEWTAAAATPWTNFYPLVARRVKEYLSGTPEHDLSQTMSTDDLVARAFPKDLPHNRTYKALNALADHELKDWWQPGVPKSILGGSKQIIPKRWRAPPATLRQYETPYPVDEVGVSSAELANEIWEILFGVLKGAVPTHIDDVVLTYVAEGLKNGYTITRKPAPEDATATPVQP